MTEEFYNFILSQFNSLLTNPGNRYRPGTDVDIDLRTLRVEHRPLCCDIYAEHRTLGSVCVFGGIPTRGQAVAIVEMCKQTELLFI